MVMVIVIVVFANFAAAAADAEFSSVSDYFLLLLCT